ncbi:MAG: DNA polymerase III subunit chi [Sphingomonadales bacterium]|nr:DNA polymerase III subunit chi [Sphingomonadales bacterium]
MQVDFYQLSHDPVGRALALIAGKVLDGGQRLLVVADGDARRAGLGEALWSAGPTRFLANGEADGTADTRQPILLSAHVAPGNGARNVALADGVWRDAVLDGRFDRVFLLFDEETVVAARQCWKALGGRDGLARRFWKQVDGRWTQAA